MTSSIRGMLVFPFKGFDEDIAEPYKAVQDCIETTPPTEVGGTATYNALNGRGRRALQITDKKTPEYFINLMNAFKNFNCLLPSNLEIGIRIYLASPEKYFTTSTRCRAKFKILEAKLLVEFILLKPVLLQVTGSTVFLRQRKLMKWLGQ